MFAGDSYDIHFIAAYAATVGGLSGSGFVAN
jgi:hypothetical protein